MGIRNFIESLKKELGEGEPAEGEEDIPRESEGRKDEEIANEKAKEMMGARKEKPKAQEPKPKISESQPEKGGSKHESQKKPIFPSLSLKPPKTGEPADGTYAQSTELEEAKEDAKLVTSEEKYAKEIAAQDEEESGGGEETGSDEYGGGAQEPGTGRGGRLSSGESVSSVRLGIEIDKLKAQVTALREMRSISEEKFYKINEEIGQLKNTIFEIEKNTVDLKKRAEIAASLVEAVQPQNLLKEVKRLEIEIEKVGAVQEKGTTLQDKINDELKDVRARIAVFRGADAIRELNEEMQKELTELKKTEASIEQHADKVEYIYVMFQKKFSKFEPIFQQVSELNAALNKLRADSEKIRVDFKGLATKSEFAELENSVKIKSEAMDKFLGGAAKIQNEFEGMKNEAEASMQKTVQDSLEYLKKYVDDTKNAQAETAKEFYEESEGILAKLRDYQKSSEKEATGLISEVRETVGSTERGFERRIRELKEDWEDARGEIRKVSAKVEKLALASEEASVFTSDLRKIRELERENVILREDTHRLEENVDRVIRKFVEEVNGEFARMGAQVRRIEDIENKIDALSGGVSVQDSEKIEALVAQTGRKVEERMQRVDDAVLKIGNAMQGKIREEIALLKLGSPEDIRALRQEVNGLKEKIDVQILRDLHHPNSAEFGDGIYSGKGFVGKVGAGKEAITPPHRLYGVEEELKRTLEAGMQEKKKMVERSDEEFGIGIRGIEREEEKGLEFVKRGEEHEIESERVPVNGAQDPRLKTEDREGWEHRLDKLAEGLKKDSKPIIEAPPKKEVPIEKMSELKIRPPRMGEPSEKKEMPVQKPPEIKGKEAEGVPENGEQKEAEMQRTMPKGKPKFESEEAEAKTQDSRLTTKEYMPVKEYRPPPRIDALTPKQYPKLETGGSGPKTGQWEDYPKKTEASLPETPVAGAQTYAWSPEAHHAESFKVGEKWGGFLKKLSGTFGKKEAGEPTPA